MTGPRLLPATRMGASSRASLRPGAWRDAVCGLGAPSGWRSRGHEDGVTRSCGVVRRVVPLPVVAGLSFRGLWSRSGRVPGSSGAGATGELYAATGRRSSPKPQDVVVRWRFASQHVGSVRVHARWPSVHTRATVIHSRQVPCPRPCTGLSTEHLFYCNAPLPALPRTRPAAHSPMYPSGGQYRGRSVRTSGSTRGAGITDTSAASSCATTRVAGPCARSGAKSCASSRPAGVGSTRGGGHARLPAADAADRGQAPVCARSMAR